jgi:hypothetical protein
MMLKKLFLSTYSLGGVALPGEIYSVGAGVALVLPSGPFVVVFTPSNPSLTFGGFEGETKMEMYPAAAQGFLSKDDSYFA